VVVLGRVLYCIGRRLGLRSEFVLLKERVRCCELGSGIVFKKGRIKWLCIGRVLYCIGRR